MVQPLNGSTIQVKDDEIVEVKMFFSKRGYTNLVKGKLNLLSPDLKSGKDLSELDFAHNIITRVNHGRRGQQEFRIKLDNTEGFTALNSERMVVESRSNTDGITHHYILKKDHDIKLE